MVQLVQELIANTKDVSLRPFAPEIALCVTIVVMLLSRLFDALRRLDACWLALVGTLASLALVVPWADLREAESLVTLLGSIERQEIFTGMLVYDPFSVFVRGLLMTFAVLFVVFTKLSGFPSRADATDFYCLFLGSTLGMCLMASANHMLMVFMAVEMASVPSYVLAGSLRKPRSSEAALKYAVYGAGAAGVMVYGISLLSGVLNSAHLPTMAAQLAGLLNAGELGGGETMVLALGTLMVMVGLAFKLSAVPFHFWAPDVFEGAAAEVGAFLSIASKAAALALLVRIALGLGTVPAAATVDASPDESETAAVNVHLSPSGGLMSIDDRLLLAQAEDATPAGDEAETIRDDQPTPPVPPSGTDDSNETDVELSVPADEPDVSSPADGELELTTDLETEPIRLNEPPIVNDGSSEESSAEAGTATSPHDEEHLEAHAVPLNHEDATKALAPVRQFAALLIALLAAITCTFGNLAAYAQTELKRLLAYSTIAHAGYMMMAIPAGLMLVGLDSDGAQTAIGALLLYVSIYLFMNLVAFAVVAFLRNKINSERIADYGGLIRQCPGLVICLGAALFSLVGLPPLAGFIGKFAIFASLFDGYQVTANNGTAATFLVVLLIVGGINTAISLFYYLKVVKVMTIDPEPEDRPPIEFSMVSLSGAFLFLITVPLVILIINWNTINELTRAAANHLL